MKTSKKLFAILLCLIMVCSTFVLSVGAEELQIDTEIQSNVETCVGTMSMKFLKMENR